MNENNEVVLPKVPGPGALQRVEATVYDAVAYSDETRFKAYGLVRRLPEAERRARRMAYGLIRNTGMQGAIPGLGTCDRIIRPAEYGAATLEPDDYIWTVAPDLNIATGMLKEAGRAKRDAAAKSERAADERVRAQNAREHEARNGEQFARAANTYLFASAFIGLHRHGQPKPDDVRGLAPHELEAVTLLSGAQMAMTVSEYCGISTPPASAPEGDVPAGDWNDFEEVIDAALAAVVKS